MLPANAAEVVGFVGTRGGLGFGPILGADCASGEHPDTGHEPGAVAPLHHQRLEAATAVAAAAAHQYHRRGWTWLGPGHRSHPIARSADRTLPSPRIARWT